MPRKVPAQTDPLFDTVNFSKKKFRGTDNPPSPRTIERWRTNGTGPDFIRVGRRVFYRESAIDRWLDKQTRTHTNESGT